MKDSGHAGGVFFSPADGCSYGEIDIDQIGGLSIHVKDGKGGGLDFKLPLLVFDGRGSVHIDKGDSGAEADGADIFQLIVLQVYQPRGGEPGPTRVGQEIVKERPGGQGGESIRRALRLVNGG